jgi:hypothetical protein
MQARFQVQRSLAEDVEITGVVVIGAGGGTNVTLVVFAEDQRVERTTKTDKEGRFRFSVPTAGDVRLEIEKVERSGTPSWVTMTRFDANVTATKLGDRVIVGTIGPEIPSIGNWCY